MHREHQALGRPLHPRRRDVDRADGFAVGTEDRRRRARAAAERFDEVFIADHRFGSAGDERGAGAVRAHPPLRPVVTGLQPGVAQQRRIVARAEQHDRIRIGHVDDVRGGAEDRRNPVEVLARRRDQVGARAEAQGEVVVRNPVEWRVPWIDTGRSAPAPGLLDDPAQWRSLGEPRQEVGPVCRAADRRRGRHAARGGYGSCGWERAHQDNTPGARLTATLPRAIAPLFSRGRGPAP